ncbi:MAG: protein BatD [Spirochaetes bacterium]|nr:protein BatD [Spirochaetota bacterium]
MFADEISVTLKLNRFDAGISDTIRMTVSVKGSREADNPGIKGLEDFSVRSGGQSSRVEMINGKFSSSLDFTYFLQPEKEGSFDIGPAFVKVDGKVYKSNTEKLTVTKQGAQPGKGNTDKPVFLAATLSSGTAYIEEQLSYILRLYYIAGISNVSLDMPEIEGLTFKQLGKPVEYTSRYKSGNYNVIEIRFSLVPSKPGRFEIVPAKMGMRVRISGDSDLFEDFFSSDDFFTSVRGRSVTVASNSPVLNVLPVSEKGKPADYTGMIGRFNISAELDPPRVKAGESSTLTVLIKGTGNINRIPDLEFPEIENLKIYPDEPAIETEQTDKGLIGIKTMKWAIVPEKEGLYTIPYLEISYFDSGRKAYLRKKTQTFKLIVDPGTGEMAEPKFVKGGSAQLKKPVEELAEDIFPIHKSAVNFSKSVSFNLLWLLLIIVPFFSFCTAYVIYIVKKPTPEKEAKMLAAGAAKGFLKKCKNEDLNADDLSDSIRDYFNKRFNLQLGSIAPDEASSILKAGGCNQDTIGQMEWLLKKLETFIYTGKGSEPCDMHEEAALIIKSIEKEIK